MFKFNYCLVYFLLYHESQIILDLFRKTRTCIHTPGNPAMVPEELARSKLSSALDGASLAYFDGRLWETALVVAQEVIISVLALWLQYFLFCLCFLTLTVMIQVEESNTSKICKMDPCYHQGKCDCQVKFYAVGARMWYPVVSHETESLRFLLTKGSGSPWTIVLVFLIQSYIYNYDDMMVKWTFMWSFLLIPIYSLKSYSLASSLCMNRPIQLKPCHLPYISTLLLQTQTNVCIHLCSWHA